MTAESLKDKKEREPNSQGILLVITGRSSAGKDTVIEKLLIDPRLQELQFSRVVTHATRLPRIDQTTGETEVNGVHYHFTSLSMFQNMNNKGEFVEKPAGTGESFKATSKAELMQVLAGKNKIWRIEPNLAGQVASGEFFDKLGPQGDLIRDRTVVIFVEADEKTILKRRMQRDGDGFNIRDYQLRDQQEQEPIEKYDNYFNHRIQNPDGENDAVDQIVDLILEKQSELQTTEIE